MVRDGVYVVIVGYAEEVEEGVSLLVLVVALRRAHKVDGLPYDAPLDRYGDPQPPSDGSMVGNVWPGAPMARGCRPSHWRDRSGGFWVRERGETRERKRKRGKAGK